MPLAGLASSFGTKQGGHEEMAKQHGARQQKKRAKHKSKRVQKRASLFRRGSKDPTLRFQGVEKWPVLESFVGSELWKDGIGYLAITRQDAGGQLVYGVYLVDVRCLGVKNAFWGEGAEEFKNVARNMENTQRMKPIPAAGLVKLVRGAVEFAKSFGLSPHPDFRHASRLLEGIDPANYPQDFTFGRNGKPFYVHGPFETLAEAQVIVQRVTEAGGHYIAMAPPDFDDDEFDFSEDEFDELDPDELMDELT
jgi:hypothetical protein